MSANYSWWQTKVIIDKVPRHLCGHCNITEMHLLLQGNNMRSDMVADYVGKLVESCVACRSAAPPQPSRKVSITYLSCSFNEVFWVDHFYLHSVCIFHCIDMATRYSAAHIVSSTSFDQEIIGFESACVSQFWISEAIQVDSALRVAFFKTYLCALNVKLRIVPPQRHRRNPLESNMAWFAEVSWNYLLEIPMSILNYILFAPYNI